MSRRRGQYDKRPRRNLDPEQARSRRMSTYPTEMDRILQAIRDQREYRKQFGDWNLAVAFLARYYKFRIDAIASGVQGATLLRDTVATGINLKTGTRLASNIPEEGPFEVGWVFAGSKLDIEAAIEHDLRTSEAQQRAIGVQVQEPPALESSQVMTAAQRDSDPLERMLHEATQQKRKENLHDFDQLICEHEWDANNIFCLKCERPYEEKK
jgi:hypothetical protein